MKNTIDTIDHIVYCTHDLSQGIDHIESLIGVKATYGGRHLKRGTHNANIKIGTNSYLEILAPDPDNQDIKAPRWMGIDLIDKPKITRWAIKSNNINNHSEILRNYNPEYGIIQLGERALADGAILKWSLTDPLNTPEVEAMPFLLDWKKSIHPTLHMNQLCSITSIGLNHPEPEHLGLFINKLELNIPIIKSKFRAITITLSTPKGIVKIS